MGSTPCRDKSERPAQRRSPPELLQEARALKRRVRLGVYATIVAFMPFDFFLIGQTLGELAVNNILYIVVATLAIEATFAQIFRLRKRIVFPSAVILQIGSLGTVAEAAESSLQVLRGFLGFQAAFLALRRRGDDPAPVAATGMSAESAARICELAVAEIRQAMATREPVQAGSVRNYRLVLVPLIAAQEPIGVLALSGERANRDLLDKQVLAGVGSALGLFLEGLSQKEQLHRSEARNRALLNAIPDTMVRMDRLGVILDFISKQAPASRRLVPEQPAGSMVFDLLPPETAQVARHTLDQALRTGAVQVFEFAFPRDDGEMSHREVRVVPAGKDEVLAIVRDITERKRAESALAASEERLRRIFEDAPIGMVIVGPDLQIWNANKAFCEMLGYTEEELIAAGIAGVTYPDDVEADLAWARQLIAGEISEYRLEKRYLKKGGEIVWGDLSASVIRDANGEVSYGIGMIENVTERKRAEETIRRLAFHDALTGLPNRALFRDRLELALAQARRSGQKAAVMFMDLDRFKVVNDTAGHPEGDTLLRHVAGHLTRLVREGDTVARVGGDEFTILLPTINRAEDAIHIAERILNSLKRPQVLGGREYVATGSIGITIYPDDGPDADTLLRNADVAMYRAKELGRNQYQMYAPAMNVDISDRLALETSMRHALDRGEFVVHYQPQVDIATLHVVGIEALVRWQHPQRGLILPGDFIHVAEETGLIVPLGEWVLRTACAQNRAWQDRGFPAMRVAVNLSARQFRQHNLIDTVRAALNETGLDTRSLQLEITEGVAMHDPELTVAMLRDLKEMGVGIAVDDFGIGHSSLNYLKRFPIDAVKIDCSFVKGLIVDPVDAALVTAIIAMSHSLGLKVIAEGVETEEQLAFLKDPQGHIAGMEDRRCDEFQGYLFSHPLPPAELEGVLKRATRPRSRSSADRELVGSGE